MIEKEKKKKKKKKILKSFTKYYSPATIGPFFLDYFYTLYNFQEPKTGKLHVGLLIYSICIGKNV